MSKVGETLRPAGDISISKQQLPSISWLPPETYYKIVSCYGANLYPKTLNVTMEPSTAISCELGLSAPSLVLISTGPA